MKLNTAETEEEDPTLGNKDILAPEAILDHDTLDHRTTDSNLIIEIVKTKHIRTHIKTKITVDHVEIPTPKVPAEVDPIQKTEKDQIPSIEIGHHP